MMVRLWWLNPQQPENVLWFMVVLEKPERDSKLVIEVHVAQTARTIEEWITFILQNINNVNDCWEYTNRQDKYRYGEIIVGGRTGKHKLVHRLMYKHFNGVIPEGKLVLHRCDNPPCCNPAHLFLGSHQDNIDDKVKKNRAYRSRGEKSGMHKLTTEQVKAIKEDSRSNKEMTIIYGVAKSTISMIRSGKSRIYE